MQQLNFEVLHLVVSASSLPGSEHAHAARIACVHTKQDKKKKAGVGGSYFHKRGIYVIMLTRKR